MPDDHRGSSLHTEWMKQWEQSVSKWWDTAIEDPAFTSSMGDVLSGRARARAMQSASAERILDQMHLPSRQDVIRLAKIASVLEDRLVALEDRLEVVNERLACMEKESLRSRIDMMEALVRIEERMSTLPGDSSAQSAKKPSPPRRKRSE